MSDQQQPAAKQRRPAAPPFAIQVASRARLVEIVDLIERSYRGEASRLGWTTEADLIDGQRTDLDEVTRLFERRQSWFLLAVEEESVRGVLNLQLDGARAYVGMVSVEPALQGQGLGARLLTEAERRCRDHGAPFVEMTVISQRRELIAWYKRRGYRPTGATAPFPYGQPRFGTPRRDDLHFVFLRKSLACDPQP